ncbi:hypothetical protein DUNSADRAFT_12239 [Dunaliella salina]|uniref:Uncharacterized protein n=1 Tax=Dunaliella salina TaxID=3046 RepID=A0ABQ7GBN7_DUNSA|nr:hypothetical protein DUNSADRAFT_12239 [Dunaliella salina]|eukprot:KAF5832023.1 hypothetical protein DUNSADRAFT_12239 [Dunaliella salina]
MEQGAAAKSRAKVNVLQDEYSKDIIASSSAIAPRGSNKGMADAPSSDDKTASELANTLAQLQGRLDAQRARSTSPWGSPDKGGSAGSAGSGSVLRNAERELSLLNARLEKAQKNGTVQSSSAKVPPEHLMGLAAASINHRRHPNPGARATSNGPAHGWLDKQGLVEGGRVQGLVHAPHGTLGAPGTFETGPHVLADLEHMQKQLKHASSRPLHMSHAQAPWPSHALRGRSNSSSSDGSSTSTSTSSSSTNGVKRERGGPIGARMHRKCHAHHHSKHRDAALASLLKAKQPGIVTLQQQLQQLGETVEKKKAPHSMWHESHKLPSRGDPIAQTSAEGKHTSSHEPPHSYKPPPLHSEPTFNFQSDPRPPLDHLQPPTLIPPSQYLHHPPPPAPSLHHPPAQHHANGHRTHQDPSPYSSPPRVRSTPHDPQRALYPPATTGESVLLSSPRALAVGNGIGHFRLSDPLETDAQWLRSANAERPLHAAAAAAANGRMAPELVAWEAGRATGVEEQRQQQQKRLHDAAVGGGLVGSAMSGAGVPSSGLSAGAQAREELEVRLQQIREEVERGMAKGGGGIAGSEGLLIGRNGAGGQAGHLRRWLEAQKESMEGDLHSQAAGGGGSGEGASHSLQHHQQQQLQGQWEGQRQKGHSLQQQFLLAENARLRTQLDEVQALLQEAQRAQQAKPQPVVVPCSQCARSAAQLQEARAVNVEHAAELASLRIALQEARTQKSNHSAQLAEMQAALDQKARGDAAAHASLLADLRSIYKAATTRCKVLANGPPDQEEGPDFLSYPQPSALAEALHRRMKQLVTAVEVQDSELRAMEAQLQRARVMSGQSTLEAETQVAEAEAARDEAVRQGQLQQQELREELHTLRKTRQHEVEELQRKLRMSEDALESASQAAHLREYGAALEHRLSRLNEDSMDLKLAKEDAAALRRQVQELRNLVRRNEDSHTELLVVKDQLSDLVGEAEQHADHVQALQGDVRSLRGQLDAERELLAARTSDLEAMRGDLRATLSQLEQVTASKDSLKEQLTKQAREAASLRAEAADRTRENIELHEGVAVAQERAAAAEATARKVLEAGNSGGLMQQNAALKARVAELQDTLGSLESERIRLAEKWSTDAKNAQARAQDLEAKLQGVTADNKEAHAAAHTMAKDIQAVADAAKLRTALARMEGTADELRNQLAQTKQQMETMVSPADSNKLRDQLKDAEEKLSISAAQVEDLRAAEREYQQAIEQMEAELHNSQISAMQVSTMVQALREDLDATSSQRDELASRIDSLEGPQGPLNRVRELETGLQRERQTNSSLSQQLATASLEHEQISEELQKKEALIYQLDGTAQILREEVTRLRRQYGEEFV